MTKKFEEQDSTRRDERTARKERSGSDGDKRTLRNNKDETGASREAKGSEWCTERCIVLTCLFHGKLIKSPGHVSGREVTIFQSVAYFFDGRYRPTRPNGLLV